MRNSACALVLLAAIAFGDTAVAQSAEGNEDIVLKEKNTDLIGSFDIDTTIPDSPGFAAIGVDPASVLDPGVDPITFASLTQFLDEDRNLKSGFALGGSPYWWGNDRKRLWDYRHNTSPLERIAARASISAAFADGGEAKTDKLGFGIKTDLLDDNDYRLDAALYDCVATAYAPVGLQFRPTAEQQEAFAAEALKRLVAGGNSQPTDEAVDDLAFEIETAWRRGVETGAASALYDKKRTGCQEEASKRNAVKPSFVVAAGVSVVLDNGDATDWEATGGNLWMAYRYPLGIIGGQAAGIDPATNNPIETKPSYVTFSVNYAFDQVEKAGAEEVKSDAAVFGLIGGYETDTMRVSAQVGYKYVDYAGNAAGLTDDSYSVFSVGAALRINKNLWLKVDAGETGERQAVSDRRDSYVKLSFAYDLG